MEEAIKQSKAEEVIFGIHTSPHPTLSIATILKISLNKASDSTPYWETTRAYVLENPKEVIGTVFDMLEDIEPTGGYAFNPSDPNGIKEFVAKYATTRGYKLEGETLDPEQEKLRVLATCIDSLDKDCTRFKEAIMCMGDLHRDEPQRTKDKLEWITATKQKMPHWDNPTDQAVLEAMRALDRRKNIVRQALESIGQTTSPDKYPQTLASLFANLSIVQAMDFEQSRELSEFFNYNKTAERKFHAVIS
jgi:hypothetical protein